MVGPEIKSKAAGEGGGGVKIGKACTDCVAYTLSFAFKLGFHGDLNS